MEAFRSLIRGHLAPAGESIVGPGGLNSDLPSFPGYETTWLDSGTSALALALVDCVSRIQNSDRQEVIIPTYCCPDLLSAVHFAGLRPVAVDITVGDTGYNLDCLKLALSERTLAVIAVNFLGIAESLGPLKSLVRQYPDIALIEDNAQWFPQPAEYSSLAGDYVVFSFGRGKPVSLLGGGVLLRSDELEAAVEPPDQAPPTGSLSTRVKHELYNRLLNPFLYQWLTRNPFIKLGETQYQPHLWLGAMDGYRQTLVEPNLRRFHRNPTRVSQVFDEALSEINGLPTMQSARRRRLLRYPILVSTSHQRDKLVHLLRNFGATALYRKSIDYYASGLPFELAHGKEGAEYLASRLLTLPIHSKVTPVFQDRIIQIFRQELPQY